MKRTLCWFAAVLVPLTLGATGSARPAFAEPLPVFVSVAPQSYFVEKIGGERVAVSVMVPPGASPATYEPKPAQMRDLSDAALYFAVGVPFERNHDNPATAPAPLAESIERSLCSAHESLQQPGMRRRKLTELARRPLSLNHRPT